MSEHYQKEKHPLVISFADLSIWCYECDSYIENRLVQDYVVKEIHRRKFGREKF